jgi:hypothetical protein
MRAAGIVDVTPFDMLGVVEVVPQYNGSYAQHRG